MPDTLAEPPAARAPCPPSLQQYTELAESAGGFIHEIKNHLGTLALNLQLLAENIESNWFPAPDLPPVCLDVELFEQALLNLLLNAEQAMPDGGTLTLIGRVEQSDESRVTSDEKKTETELVTRWVCLDVIDTGHG